MGAVRSSYSRYGGNPEEWMSKKKRKQLARAAEEAAANGLPPPPGAAALASGAAAVGPSSMFGRPPKAPSSAYDFNPALSQQPQSEDEDDNFEGAYVDEPG